MLGQFRLPALGMDHASGTIFGGTAAPGRSVGNGSGPVVIVEDVERAFARIIDDVHRLLVGPEGDEDDIPSDGNALVSVRERSRYCHAELSS